MSAARAPVTRDVARVDAILGERLLRQGLLGRGLQGQGPVGQGPVGQGPVGQGPVHAGLADAADVVGRLAAVQAQEFDDACRALAHRVSGSPDVAGIARRIGSGDLVRTHVLRPTWHVVLVQDIDWMLALTGPRVHAQIRSQYRAAGIEPGGRLIGLVGTILDEAARPLTRKQIGVGLAERGVRISGTPLTQLTAAAELDRVAITGPREGRWDTFVPYRSRVPVGPVLDRDEAVCRLAQRFLAGHAPAGLRDFAWWSGLTLTDARRGFEAAGARVVDDDLFTLAEVSATARGTAFLLSLFDEYVISYADRSLIQVGSPLDVWGNNVLAVDGRLAGGWRIVRPKRVADVTVVDLIPARPLTTSARELLEAEAQRVRATIEGPSETRWSS